MNTKSFHDSVILVTKLTQTQHEICCVLLNFFCLLSPGPCVRSGIKKFHNFLVGVDMNFVKQFDLLKKSVSKGGKTENNHKKTNFPLYKIKIRSYELNIQARAGRILSTGGWPRPIMRMGQSLPSVTLTTGGWRDQRAPTSATCSSRGSTPRKHDECHQG